MAPVMLTVVIPRLDCTQKLLMHRQPDVLDHWLPQLPLAADECRRFRGSCRPRIHAKRLKLLLDRRLLEYSLQVLADLAYDGVRRSSPRHECEPPRNAKVGNRFGNGRQIGKIREPCRRSDCECLDRACLE